MPTAMPRTAAKAPVSVSGSDQSSSMPEATRCLFNLAGLSVICLLRTAAGACLQLLENARGVGHLVLHCAASIAACSNYAKPAGVLSTERTEGSESADVIAEASVEQPTSN